MRDRNFCGFRNNAGMRTMDERDRAWLRERLDSQPRGVRKRLAQHLGVQPEVISRMTSESGDKGTPRRISMAEASRIAQFFGEPLPSLAVIHKAPTVVSPPREARMAPLLSWVSAGRLSESVPTPDADQQVAVGDLPAGDYIALTVRGDSMDRCSPEGSIILVNRRDQTLQRGKPYVFSVRGEATFKLWEPGEPGYLAPYSTNPTNRPIFIKRKRDLFVVGRVKRTILDL